MNLKMILEIIKDTPVYVWLILIVLLSRGLSSAKSSTLSFPKMLIVPVIFIIWGLDKLVTRFSYLGLTLALYFVMTGVGASVGYFLYKKYRNIYVEGHTLMKSGTYLSLIIMMVNFFVKYLLNVALAIHESLYSSIPFCLSYSILCGFSVGLFIGGILQAYCAYLCLRRELLNEESM